MIKRWLRRVLRPITVTLNDRCRTCKHHSVTHFRGKDSCLFSTPTQVWACNCVGFR